MIGRAALAVALAAAATGAARATVWPGAIEAGGRALTAGPESERADAVARFVARYGAAAGAPWLPPLMAEGPPQARLLVARVLVRAGDSVARQQALTWLTGPSSTPGDRTLGLDALSFGAAAPEVRAAFEQAARDPDAQTRAQALDALGRLDAAGAGGASPSLPVILGCLDDLDREVRVRAVRLVARAASLDRAATASAAPLLLERLDDADRLVRVTALGALGALRDPRVVPALLRVAAAEPPDLQVSALDALGWPGAAAAVPFLSTLLQRRPADEAAGHAARALGGIATPAAIAALIGALRSPPVADEIGRGLVDAGAAAVGPLLRELDGADLATAARAVALLADIGDPRALAPLARAVRHRGGTGPLVLVAVAALGRLHQPQALAALAEATASSEPEVRRAALDALGALSDSHAAGLIDQGLTDADPTVRAAAARLAARLGPGDQTAALLADRFGDDAGEVRLAAAQALRTFPVPAAAARRDLLARALAAASARLANRSDEELQAIGDVLESLATPDDASRLDTAFRAGGSTRALAGALRAAHARDALTDHDIVRRLLDELAGAPAAALAAADALAAARLSDDDAAPLARAARDGEPALRARLCAVVSQLSDGAGWLAAWMEPDQPPEVRAAAAWAARPHPKLADLLRRLGDGPDARVAANARAALAWSKHRTAAASFGARLVQTDGTPVAGRWVTVRGGDLSLAVRSDGGGGVRVDGLPAGAVLE
ncbi:MAG: HEAT repeat domain-containing protein [Polyangia bacterium]